MKKGRMSSSCAFLIELPDSYPLLPSVLLAVVAPTGAVPACTMLSGIR
jgi:hypothetical protein